MRRFDSSKIVTEINTPSTGNKLSEKGCDVICNLKALQARHNVKLVLPYGEVNTIVVIKPKKEGDQRDERRK